MIAIDPQINGSYDDGSRDGAVRARLVRGDIVRMPFKEGAFQTETQGSSSATLNYSTNWTVNTDGSCSALVLSTAQVVPGTVSGGAKIWHPFYGRVFGLRWRTEATATPAFSVKVDGRPFLVPSVNAVTTYPWCEVPLGIRPEASMIIADDLADNVQHWAEIYLAGVPTAGNQTVSIFGMWLDGRYYATPPPSLSQINTGSLTTAAQTVPRTVGTGGAAYNTVRQIRGIIYYNTDTVARLVTLQLPSGGGTGSPTTIAQRSLAAGETWTFDLLGRAVFPFSSTSTALSHLSDANAVVTYTVLGGM